MEQKTERKRYRLILIPVIAAMMLFGMCTTAWAETILEVGDTNVQVSAESAGGVGWSYKKSSRTLTLNGFSYSGNKNGIWYSGGDELNIVLTGANTISCKGAYSGIFVSTTANLNFSGSGSLSVNSDGDLSKSPTAIYSQSTGNITIKSGAVTAVGDGIGIRSVKGNIIIKGGNLTAEGSDCGIFSDFGAVKIGAGSVNATGGKYGIDGPNISITGGTVTATGGNTGNGCGIIGAGGSGTVTINGGKVTATGYAQGIYATNTVTISGGTVIATSNSYGIATNSNNPNSFTSISGENTLVTAVGAGAAIRGKIINQIEGFGWTNTAGTQGKAEIDINTAGRKLDNYKKLRFPMILDPATVTTKPAAKSLTYTGSAQELVTAGRAEGGQMLYAIGTSTVTAPADGWKTSVPTGTDAKTYHVWYMAKGDENHSDSKPVPVDVTISEVPPEPPAPPVPPTPPAPEPTPSIADSTDILMNSEFRLSWSGRKMKAAWGSAPGADSYEVWAAPCGTSAFEKVCTVQANKATIKSLKGKKLSRKKCVKAYVVAMRAGTEIGRTFIGHTAGPENRHTNAKKVTVSKTAYSLLVGQTEKIQAKIVKAKKGRKLLHGNNLVYASSNPAVAAVSAGGTISAVGAGSCEVWVYALNGKRQKLTVTVQ